MAIVLKETPHSPVLYQDIFPKGVDFRIWSLGHGPNQCLKICCYGLKDVAKVTVSVFFLGGGGGREEKSLGSV